MEPRFLTLARILRLHRESIEHYGGDISVRDMGLLESAIAQPRATYGGQYLHEDLPAMAGAYLYHIVMNHPFVDGNKRTAALAAFVFLELNGIELLADEKTFEQLVLSTARGETGKEEAISFFRNNSKPMKE